ncbi:hypothetical protein L1987_06487 [Smallanthus sonchifolius]|uniref:Uncharacterized protein n=1 Tax=Smallanthus sonchifolius TaxID=185202 RepID=A0ACB9JYA3_9ASTR|nr:hypothetical protein L1987_06487 [Smallanthus sonchifolius]
MGSLVGNQAATTQCSEQVDKTQNMPGPESLGQVQKAAKVYKKPRNEKPNPGTFGDFLPNHSNAIYSRAGQSDLSSFKTATSVH